jgi:hypothetical protein
MTATVAAKPAKQPKPLPAPNSDFYEVYGTLNAEELVTVKKVRAFMEAKVAPVVTKYWVNDAFPFDLLPGVKDLGIGGLGMQGYGCLGLCEPLVGSGASGRLTTTTAKRDGDSWILKARSVGSAMSHGATSPSFGRAISPIIRSRGSSSRTRRPPGFSVEKIENKIALKVVQNGHITMKDVRVPEANRLQGGNSFRDTAKVLKMAVKFALTAVNKGLETSQNEGLLLEASYFGLCAGTEDKREGTSAFLERSAPQFRGR